LTTTASSSSLEHHELDATHRSTIAGKLKELLALSPFRP
jgi:hypothetical protein